MGRAGTFMERLEDLARECEAPLRGEGLVDRLTWLEKLLRIDLFAPHSSQAL